MRIFGKQAPGAKFYDFDPIIPMERFDYGTQTFMPVFPILRTAKLMRRIRLDNDRKPCGMPFAWTCKQHVQLKAGKLIQAGPHQLHYQLKSLREFRRFPGQSYAILSPPGKSKRIFAIEPIMDLIAKKLRLLPSAIMLAFAMLLHGCGGPEETAQPWSTKAPGTETILIRMTTPVPPGDDLSKICQEGMNTFNARTRGAYKMQMFPGGQLANLPESLDAIRTGAVEGGVIPLAAFSGTAPEFGLAELPFLYNNGEANADAMMRLKDVYGEILQKKANQRSLGCIYVGTLNLLSAKKPIKILEDIKGLIVGCDTPSSANLITALGGSGIVVDFSEDYSNLQKGVINAKTSAHQYMLIAKLYEVAKYYTVFHGLGSLYSININSDVYEAMPPEIQDVVIKEMSELARKISRYYVKLFYELADDLEAKGVKFYYLPKAEHDRWKDLAYPGTLAKLRGFGDTGSKIKQIADEANARYPYRDLK